jgi:hypothetical protein
LPGTSNKNTLGRCLKKPGQKNNKKQWGFHTGFMNSRLLGPIVLALMAEP